MTPKKLVLSATAAAAAVLAFASPSMATPTKTAPNPGATIIPISGPDPVGTSFNITYGNPYSSPIIANFAATIQGANTSFDDAFEFTIPQTGIGSGHLSTSFDSEVDLLTISTVYIDGEQFTPMVGNDGAGQSLTVKNIPISPGKLNYIEVIGKTGANAMAGSFTGGATFSATSATPEPATWLLMIGGLGFAGTMMRRRQTAVAFA